MMSKAPQPQGPDTGLIYALSHPWQWALAAAWRGLSRHWRGLGVMVAAVVVAVWWGSAWAGVVVLVLAVGAWVYFRRGTPGKGWWSHPVLPQAMVDAGILRKDGDALPSLSYRGKPAHDDHGTSVIVGLPQAKTVDDLLTRRKALASALRVPENRLHISADPEDPANVVRIHVSAVRKGEVPPPVATADVTDWREPVAIGHDSRGRAVELETFQHNSLFGGQPGSGKTATGRTVVSHFLLDPTTSIFVLDGKGAIDDYGACRPLCARFVSGTADNAVPDTLAMLADIHAEVQRRNSVGGQHPGWLVVLEELQDVRAACTKDQLERLDTLVGRIIRQGRAVGVVLLILTQKPSADSIPTGVRSQVSQRLALKLRSDDYRLVLGDRPTVATPRVPGVGVWTNGDDHELVTLYHLTAAAWLKVCKRATQLRKRSGGVSGERLAIEDEPTRPLAVVPQPPDELLTAVVDMLADADPRGLPATAIWSRLPVHLQARCPTPVALGRALARWPDRVERAHIDSARGWKLAANASPDLSAWAE